MMRNIFILLGHPDKNTFSGLLADTYEKAAREAGHGVRRVNLGEIDFDPVLHKGYKEIQELEPGLVTIQENITWADHVVIVYPNWWNTMPSILKGMFDRMWLPGFAFNFNKRTKKVLKLLKGKSARVIIVSGTHAPWKIRLFFGDYKNEISRGILGFSGLSPVRISSFGPSERSPDAKKEMWTTEVRMLGTKGI